MSFAESRLKEPTFKDVEGMISGKKLGSDLNEVCPTFHKVNERPMAMMRSPRRDSCLTGRNPAYSTSSPTTMPATAPKNTPVAECSSRLPKIAPTTPNQNANVKRVFVRPGR